MSISMGLSAPVALTHNEKLATWFRAQRWAIGFNYRCRIPMYCSCAHGNRRRQRPRPSYARCWQKPSAIPSPPNPRPSLNPSLCPRRRRVAAPIERSHAKAAKVSLDGSCVLALGLHWSLDGGSNVHAVGAPPLNEALNVPNVSGQRSPIARDLLLERDGVRLNRLRIERSR